MTTAEDLLKKSEARKSKTRKKFQPEKRRAWDYASKDDQNEAKNKQEQSGNEYRNINRDNWEQNGNVNRNKYGDNWEQISEQSRNEYRNINRNESKPIKQSIQYPKPCDSLLDTTPTIDPKCEAHILKILRKTAGYQKEIMEQITAHVKSMKDIDNIINIPISTLATRINTSNDITRTSIKRLQKKSILQKSLGERGRHGSTQVIVSNFIIKECLNLFDCEPQSLDEIGNKNRNKIGNTKLPYSSSIYLNNNINTTTQCNLPKIWRDINAEILEEIGFSLTQLGQLYSKSLNTPEIIQESINHFAFGLQNNPKVKKYPEPLNVLMRVLRKRQSLVRSQRHSSRLRWWLVSSPRQGSRRCTRGSRARS